MKHAIKTAKRAYCAISAMDTHPVWLSCAGGEGSAPLPAADHHVNVPAELRVITL